MDDDSTSIAKRSSQKLVFDHKDMDYYLSWIIGREETGGSLKEECLEAASRMVDRDYVSWQIAWIELAEHVESEAAEALHNGNKEQARSGYLRACTYFRAPLFIMDAQDVQFESLSQKMRSCFEQATRLFEPNIETIQVPFGDATLYGYIWKPDDTEIKRPTLIVIGGIETFAEDCYFMIGSKGTKAGYNVITVDLPGQGMNPKQGFFLEARSEIPIKAVVDYVVARNEVDTEKVALYGFSWGGHIVLRGAQYEPRIKALIANPATINIFASALAQQKGHGKDDPIGRIVFEQVAWRFGVQLGQTFKRLIKGIGFLRFAKANPKKIECPTMCMAGDSEAKITLTQTRKCYEQLPNPKKRIEILTEEQGGSAHCQVDNLPLLHQLIFSWLSEVFE
ncbi:MAG: alpha/beta hydrolase [Candidatus Thorarchaeota archaeon]|nr:MAG: alpha/beta hydrolase [Candidatus Thorarchaeota archaeon]